LLSLVVSSVVSLVSLVTLAEFCCTILKKMGLLDRMNVFNASIIVMTSPCVSLDVSLHYLGPSLFREGILDSS
jgi:hypothetical protein